MRTRILGKKELNNAMTNIFKKFGISFVRLSNEYAYYFDDESITFKVVNNEIEDLWFTDFVSERFDLIPKYTFIFYLLHELGHHFTINEIDDFSYNFCMEEKKRIESEMKSADYNRTKELEWQYFNLPDEIIATAWAVKFYKNNREEVETMWETAKSALAEFYEINGIIDEE